MSNIFRFSGKHFEFDACNSCPYPASCQQEIRTIGLKPTMFAMINSKRVTLGQITTEQAFEATADVIRNPDSVADDVELFLARRPDCEMDEVKVEGLIYSAREHYNTKVEIDFEDGLWQQNS